MHDAPVANRATLIQSIRTWSPLAAVADAVSVASAVENRIYIERLGDRYRWSLSSKGGSYPLLRVTARFAEVDYQRIVVGFRTLPDGTAIICDDPGAVVLADAWALVDVVDQVSPAEAADLVTSGIG